MTKILGIAGFVIAAIGLLIAVLLGRHLGIKGLGEPMIDNEKGCLWTIIGYVLLILGLGIAAMFFYE